ncbi:hypothetical protein [Paenibacillus cymbidii]|uniref:hypothetical protein n=1 Tax=Paenibacillus cymbidii TaxID=1639034 RepID=UPI0014368142|nr:hypothetical protein [Paenibacillus cymbidii]
MPADDSAKAQTDPEQSPFLTVDGYDGGRRRVPIAWLARVTLQRSRAGIHKEALS